MRKVTTRGFRVIRSPRWRVAHDRRLSPSEHWLYYLWTAGSEEPETSGDSPIQNDSDLSQGHRGAFVGTLGPSIGPRFFIDASGRREGDHDAPLFARPPVVGSAGHRLPTKYLGWLECARSRGFSGLVAHGTPQDGPPTRSVDSTDCLHRFAFIIVAMAFGPMVT